MLDRESEDPAYQTKRFEAITGRLEKLSQFVSAFAPAFNECHSAYDVALADDDAPPEILEARNKAIIAAFRAIDAIASDTSSIFAQG
jgi:hypothetical protein